MELRIAPEENYRLISVRQGAIYGLSMTSKLDDTSAVANPGLHVPQHKFETETSSLWNFDQKAYNMFYRFALQAQIASWLDAWSR